MTATSVEERPLPEAPTLPTAPPRRTPARRRRRPPPRRAGAAAPPLSPRLQLVRAVLVCVLLCTGMLLVQLVVVSAREHSSDQQRAFARLRSRLATGTVPIGPTDAAGHELPMGTPVAYLEIPSIGLHEVVGEGTTPGALFAGPGHRRDTPLPGQIGTSTIYGRRAAFGGPFSDLDELRAGAKINVTTGQGEFEYEVIGVRRAGDPVPAAPAAGAGRLLLATADGTPFVPNGVVRVDADLVGTAVVGAPRVRTFAGLTPAEQLMGTDPSTLWALALWLQALILVTLGGVWAWHRWGRAQAWVVFVPPVLLVGLYASGEVIRLLPNLM